MRNSTGILRATNGVASSEHKKGWITIILNIVMVFIASAAKKYGFEVDTADLAIAIGANSGVAATYMLGRTAVKRGVLAQQTAEAAAKEAKASMEQVAKTPLGEELPGLRRFERPHIPPRREEDPLRDLASRFPQQPQGFSTMPDMLTTQPQPPIA